MPHVPSIPRLFRRGVLILGPFLVFSCLFALILWESAKKSASEVQEEYTVSQIRQHWLHPPAKKYNFSWSDIMDPGPAVKSLHKLVVDLLKNKKNGFFVECGAVEGLFLSNTLHLEANLGWSGLLIEPEPNLFGRLLVNSRKAWSINACLSLNATPHKITMTRRSKDPALASVYISEEANEPSLLFQAQCFPLYTILRAVLKPPIVVDYFSLDVESAEAAILQTIPWDKLYIKVISVENNEKKRPQFLRNYMEARGYVTVRYVEGPWIHDYVFVHSRYLEENPDVGVPTSERNSKLEFSYGSLWRVPHGVHLSDIMPHKAKMALKSLTYLQ